MIAKFFQECAKEYDPTRDRTPNQVWALATLIAANRAYWFDDYDLTNPICSSQVLCSVFSVKEFLIDSSVYIRMPTRWGSGITFKNGQIPTKFRFTKHTLEVQESGTVGQKDKLLWFTDLQQLESGLRNLPKDCQTERVREVLGLAHYKAGTGVGYFKIPGVCLREVIAGKPTVFEANSHIRFRVIRDGSPSSSDLHWGVTVDLKALEKRSEVLDGLPERVALSLTSEHIKQVQVELLENLPDSVSNTTDEDFLERVLAGRKIENIELELNELCGQKLM